MKKRLGKKAILERSLMMRAKKTSWNLLEVKVELLSKRFVELHERLISTKEKLTDYGKKLKKKLGASDESSDDELDIFYQRYLEKHKTDEKEEKETKGVC